MSVYVCVGGAACAQVPGSALYVEQPRLCGVAADVAASPTSCWDAVQTQLPLAVGHTGEVCHNLELKLFSMCTAGERRLFVERDSSRPPG